MDVCDLLGGMRTQREQTGGTDLDDDRGGGIHDDPGGTLGGGPSVLVAEGGVGRVGRKVCDGHLDGEVAEHVGPVLALLHGGGKYDIDGGGDGYEEGCDAGDLEDEVGACEGPVVLCGEDEVEEEDGGEGEGDADEEDLDGEGLRKGGAVSEDGVLEVRGVLGLGHGVAEEEEQEQAWLAHRDHTGPPLGRLLGHQIGL